MITSFKKLLLLPAIALTILFALSFSSVEAAGVPSIMSYQGRLADASGNLLGGTSGTAYYFKFSIWDVSTGGTDSPNRLWPSTAPSSVSATVRHGVFNVDIGDTASGYPDALDFDFNTDSDVYLQIEVSSDNVTFQTLSPRQRISAAAFARVAAAVNGVGQSSFGTVTPTSNAVVTVQSTTTTSVPVFVRGAAGQTANLLDIQDFSSNRLFTITGSGNVGIGTGTPARKFNVVDANSVPQLRLSQGTSIYGEIYADSAGDLQLSSSGGNVRNQDENLWVCSGGSCGADQPAGTGNVIVENAVILDNNFKLKQVDASTTIMYDSADNPILEFDEGQ